MKKLFPAFLILLLIPFAFACKKGTNSTGTVTNGVARVELSISPALPANIGFYLDIMEKSPGAAGTIYGSISIPVGSTQYISDDFAVTEGQNFPCYYSCSSLNGVCVSFTSKIYYNNLLISTKSFSLGNSNCANGVTSEHNAICK